MAEKASQVSDAASEAPNAAFAQALSQLRLDAGLSVREVARHTGLPSGTLGGYFGGRHLPPANRPDVLDGIILACGGSQAEVLGWRTWLRELHRARKSPPATRQPYRGLDGFGIEDGDLYFGREDVTRELMRHVASVSADGGGLIAVVGASGAGKSSLLRAGLLCGLGQPAGAETWEYRIAALGQDPTATLDRAAGELGEQPRALLVLDQFEDLFTSVDDEDERRSVIRRVTTWVADRSADTSRVVVIGLRADYYGDAARYPELLAALRERQVLVGPMTQTELREVIERPAERVGLKLEWGLADVVLSDALGGEIAHILPHVSHALHMMWEQSDQRTARIRDYKEVGGLGGAIRRSAEESFAELSAQDRDLARTLLLRLVSLHKDTGPTRRTAALSDLQSLHPDARRLLAHLIRHRLVTVLESAVTISHEALVEAWPRLRQWVAEGRSEMLLREMVTRHEESWSEHGHDPELLLRGSQLGAAVEWATHHPAELTAAEAAFLEASTQHEEARRRATERQHRRTRRLLAASLAFALVAVIAGAVAWRGQDVLAHQRDQAQSRQMATVATTLRETDIALSGQLALAAFQTADTIGSRSALIDATSTPLLTRRLDDSGVITAAVSSSGLLLAMGATDGSVDLVRLDDDRFTDLGSVNLSDADGNGDSPMVQSVAFHPNDEMVAMGGGADHVRLLDVTSPEASVVVADLPVSQSVFGLTFGPDGEELIGAGDKGDLLRWAREGDEWVSQPPLTGLEGSVRAVAIGPQGDSLAAAALSGDIGYWQQRGGEWKRTDIARVGDGTTSQFGVAFNRSGDLLAAVGKDKTLRLFSVSPDGRLSEQAAVEEFGSWVNAVAFGTDGETVAAGSSDNTVRLWKVQGAETLPSLVTILPVSAPVTSLTPIGTDRFLITTTGDESYVWKVGGPVLPLHDDIVFTTRFSSQQEQLITAPGTTDGHIYLWDAADPFSPRLTGKLTAPEELGVLDGAAAISNDGTLVAGGTATGGLVVWDISDPVRPAVVAQQPVSTKLIDQVAFVDGDSAVAAVGNDGEINLVTVSGPDRGQPIGTADAGQPLLSVAGGTGPHLAVAGIDGTTTIWDVDDLEQPASSIPADNTIFGLDFSADDSLLAVAGAENELRLFDVTDPGRPEQLGETLNGPSTTIYSVEFSPDGSHVAAAVLDGTVWVWSRESDGMFVGETVLRSANTPMNAVGWSPDGEIVIAGGQDGQTRMWTVDTRAAAEHVCSTTGDDVTAQEWSAQLPGVEFAPPCASDPAG